MQDMKLFLYGHRSFSEHDCAQRTRRYGETPITFLPTPGDEVPLTNSISTVDEKNDVNHQIKTRRPT